MARFVAFAFARSEIDEWHERDLVIDRSSPVGVPCRNARHHASGVNLVAPEVVSDPGLAELPARVWSPSPAEGSEEIAVAAHESPKASPACYSPTRKILAWIR